MVDKEHVTVITIPFPLSIYRNHYLDLSVSIQPTQLRSGLKLPQSLSHGLKRGETSEANEVRTKIKSDNLRYSSLTCPIRIFFDDTVPVEVGRDATYSKIQRFYVLKNLICTMSTFFAATCAKQRSDANDTTIKMPDHSPTSLHVLHTGNVIVVDDESKIIPMVRVVQADWRIHRSSQAGRRHIEQFVHG